MKFSMAIEGIQQFSPKLYQALKLLATELETFFNFVSYDEDGLHIGGLTVRKDGLIRSDQGVYFRKTLESDTPICATYNQMTGSIAGAGPFTWDTVIHETSGYFSRITANTQIQVSRPGRYLVCFNGVSYNNAAGARVDATLNVGGVAYLATLGVAAGTGHAPLQLSTIVTLAAQSILDIACTAGRYGAAVIYTSVSIHKLN